MLERMGWSEGKGLGLHEDGSTAHVGVTKKSDNLGVGATKRNIDNWLDQADAFSDLLQSLNAQIVPQTNNDTPNDSAISNEEKTISVAPTGRHHHRSKYLKAKQRSMQNSNDLNEILGVRSVKDTSVQVVSVEETTEITDTSKIKMVVSKTSTADYFKSKMKLVSKPPTQSPSFNTSNDWGRPCGLGFSSGANSTPVNSVSSVNVKDAEEPTKHDDQEISTESKSNDKLQRKAEKAARKEARAERRLAKKQKS